LKVTFSGPHYFSFVVKFLLKKLKFAEIFLFATKPSDDFNKMKMFEQLKNIVTKTTIK